MKSVKSLDLCNECVYAGDNSLDTSALRELVKPGILPSLSFLDMRKNKIEFIEEIFQIYDKNINFKNDLME